MAVLVTGATGFIGRHVIARLVASRQDVRALVLPGDDTSALPELEIVRGDVARRDDMDAAMRGVTHVYHLAAKVTDWGDDAAFHAINVVGTRNVLDAAAREGCARVVVVSSIAVYGWQLRTAVCDEQTARREWGIGPYSRTKREAEEVALDYHAFGRVPVTVVRPGNVYGPGSPMWVDEIVRVLRAGGGVLVDGGRGDAVLAYVDNVVDVVVRAANSPDAAGKIYNVNDGGGVTWRDYLSDLAHAAGLEPLRRSIPTGVALAVAAGLEAAARVTGQRQRPLLTREAVMLLSSRRPVPIRRATDELGYQPLRYRDTLASVAAYIHGGTI